MVILTPHPKKKEKKINNSENSKDKRDSHFMPKSLWILSMLLLSDAGPSVPSGSIRSSSMSKVQLPKRPLVMFWWRSGREITVRNKGFVGLRRYYV